MQTSRGATLVLDAFGTVRHVGPLENAARLKLVANSMLADVILAAAELQVAGERSGLRPDDVFWVLQRQAPGLEARRQGYIGIAWPGNDLSIVLLLVGYLATSQLAIRLVPAKLAPSGQSSPSGALKESH